MSDTAPRRAEVAMAAARRQFGLGRGGVRADGVRRRARGQRRRRRPLVARARPHCRRPAHADERRRPHAARRRRHRAGADGRRQPLGCHSLERLVAAHRGRPPDPQPVQCARLLRRRPRRAGVRRRDPSRLPPWKLLRLPASTQLRATCAAATTSGRRSMPASSAWVPLPPPLAARRWRRDYADGRHHYRRGLRGAGGARAPVRRRG